MTEGMTHAPGTFCWVDLGTTDTAAAKRFYTGLLGWEAEDMPAGPMVYTMLRRGGLDVAGLSQMDPQQQAQGVPPYWTSYVAVRSADETAAKVERLGGKVMMPAFDVMDVGRMALIQDPTGAMIAIWEPRTHKGTGKKGAPSFLCWNELMTRDVPAATKFYTGLFDWGTEAMDMGDMTYTIFKQGKESVGGMMAITPEMGPMPANWVVYFAVEDCDAVVKEAGTLYGKAVVPATDIPNIGRFAVLQDPQGGTFAVIKMFG